MQHLEQQVAMAKQNKAAQNNLLADYLPFLKKQVLALQHRDVDFDDMLSIAMLTFVGCIEQYQPGQGSFLGFARVSIKNRLIDEIRRSSRYTSRVLPLLPQEDGKATPEEAAAIQTYNMGRERQSMAEEIAALDGELAGYHISFAQLVACSPRQQRSRALCYKLAQSVLQTEHLHKAFAASGKLPQTELARLCGVSAKVVEKHRKYIVALCLILQGEYPCIKAFLYPGKEVGGR